MWRGRTTTSRSRPRARGTPSLGRAVVILHGYVVLAAAVAHVLDVGAVLEGLGEVADVADDVVVALEGEGDDGLEKGGGVSQLGAEMR